MSNIPKLRFSEFSGDWEEKKLENIFKITAGGDIKPENVSLFKDHIFKYPIYANAEKNKGFYGYANIYKIEANVITVAGRGVNLGIAHARKHKFYPIVRLLVLNPKIESNIDFFEYQINNLNMLIESTGVPQLTAPQISKYKVCFPSKQEQEKIASFLTAVDKKIEQLTKKESLLQEYKKGVMQKIFNKEIRFKADDGREFCDWEEKKLGKYLVEYKEKSILENEYPVLTSSNKGLMLQSDYFGENRLTERHNQGFNIVPNNYITYRSRSDNRTFTFNLNSLGYKGIISTYYPVFKCIDGDNRFIVTLLNINKHYIGKYSVGTSQTVLSFNELKNIKIFIPSSEEQTKIANFLSSIDDKIEQIQKQLEQTKEFKKALLQTMFV